MIWFVLGIALIIRLLLAPFGTLELDFNTFVAWSNKLAKDGFLDFYNNIWSDYLPGYIYVLWFLAGLKHAFGGLPEVLLYKLPAILADLGTGFLIYSAVSRFKKKFALLSVSVYLFNPAVFANSTLWGQIEGITIFFVLLALFFADSYPKLSAGALALGALVKPQAGFIAPLVFLLWRRRFGFGKTLIATSLTLLIFTLGFVPFVGNGELLPFILERLTATASQYPYTSINAFNFWGLIHGFWYEDGVFQLIGILIVILIAGFLIFKWFSTPKPQNNYLVASCLLLIIFLFLTRMHERHLLPVFAPLIIAAISYPILWIPYAILSATYVANLHYSFVWITEDFRQIFPQELIMLFSLLNLIALGLMILVFFKRKFAKLNLFSKLKFENSLKTENFKLKIRTAEIPFIERYSKKVLIAILGFALFSRLIFLNLPNTFYFDEVYHAFTAREILRGNPAAWEFWSTPPEGFAYEWTHPPLAKLFMVAGMLVLGEGAIGWRLPGALLGVGVVFLVYLLGSALFKKKTIGILASSVFALDGLPLVMSRIGMNDIYFLFFALCTIFLFLKEKYLLSSVFLGLAAASKWTAAWVLPVIFVAMFLFRIKPRWNIFWFGVVPALVYFISYIPFFLTGHTISQFIGLQQQMWWYHTGLKASHAFQSSWWSWPLMLRPVWLFSEAKDSLVSNIYAIGNPLVFWIGMVAVIFCFIRGVLQRQRTLLFVVLAWGLLFLPWALSPRVMFLYHYLPAIPFLSLASGWFLSMQKKRVILLFFALCSVSYLFFFPHWTGIFIPSWFDSLYYWLPSWR